MIFAPILSLVLMVLGSGFFMSFISLYFKEQQLGEFHIGLVQSAFYLGMLISSLRAEKLISRIGHIRALTATCGVLSAVTLILYVVPAEQWFWFRLLAGACVGGFYVAIESWLLAEFPSAKRGRALAIYTIALYFAQSISQLFLASLEHAPAIAFVVSAFFTSLAVIPVSIGRNKGPETSGAETESFAYFIKLTPLGVAGCFLAGTMLSSLYAFMPIYVGERGFSPGPMMTIMIMGGALLQWPIGKLSDRLERRRVLFGLAVAGASCLLAIPWLNQEVWFFAGIFVIGGVFFAVYPVAMALGCNCVEPKDLVKITGVLLFAYGLGAVLGPLLTAVMKGLTPNYLLVMMGAYCLLLALAGAKGMKNRRRGEPAAQTSFNMIPTGPIVEDLQPFAASNQVFVGPEVTQEHEGEKKINE